MSPLALAVVVDTNVLLDRLDWVEELSATLRTCAAPAAIPDSAPPYEAVVLPDTVLHELDRIKVGPNRRPRPTVPAMLTCFGLVT
jgi:hypothetical protein